MTNPFVECTMPKNILWNRIIHIHVAKIVAKLISTHDASTDVCLLSLVSPQEQNEGPGNSVPIKQSQKSSTKKKLDGKQVSNAQSSSAKVILRFLLLFCQQKYWCWWGMGYKKENITIVTICLLPSFFCTKRLIATV